MGFRFYYMRISWPWQRTVRKFVENEIVPVRHDYDDPKNFPGLK
jgi:hypothetical protein